MHELAIAQSILDIVVNETQQRKVTAINLVVGELSSVAEEPIRFCFEVVAKGTLAEGATLSLLKVPALFQCRDCLCEFGLKSHGICPDCGRRNGEVVRGRECYVNTIEVEEPD
jgi:hydrogenase nickel incorporation protein HypA/HybF